MGQDKEQAGEHANSPKRDECGNPLKDISGILQRTKSRAEFEAEKLLGVTLMASHSFPCRGFEDRLKGEEIAHPVVNVYSNGTIEVMCSYIDGKGDLELCHCGSQGRYNSCVYLRHDNAVLR